MFCYIILHYKVIKETVECVQSIKKQISAQRKIVIIDNFSNNGTGEALRKQYRDDDEVDVLINSENSGFAQGNNLAYQFAKQSYQPDFMVIMNNDVEIVTSNFEGKVRDIYSQEEFHILGPDIYSTTYQLHQNPKRPMSYTYEEVKALHDKHKQESQVSFKLKLKCWLKSSQMLRKLVYQKRRTKLETSYNNKAINPILHGSCVIYSKDYIDKEDFAFNPNTFFYFEMEILDYELNKKGYKRIYYPDIKVLHHQNVATNQVYSNLIERTLFANRCGLESTGYLLKLMNEDQREN